MNWPPSVAKAVGAVRDNIGAVAKSKDPNGGVKYAFQGWDAVVPTLREACKECGLFIGVSIVGTEMNYKPTSSGGTSLWPVRLRWPASVTTSPVLLTRTRRRGSQT